MELKEFAQIVEKAYDLQQDNQAVQFKKIYQAITQQLKIRLPISQFKVLMHNLYDANWQKFEMDRGTMIYKDNDKYGFVGSDGLHCYLKIIKNSK